MEERIKAEIAALEAMQRQKEVELMVIINMINGYKRLLEPQAEQPQGDSNE